MLFALAFEMSSKTTLQNALAFLVVAIADYQGKPITVTDIVRRAERDLHDNPVFTGNLRRSYVDLLDQELISAKARTDAENFNDLRLTVKGKSLAARVNARVNGNLFEPT